VFSGGELALDEDMRQLRNLWEETSYQIEKRQANPDCVEEERASLADRKAPDYSLTFTPRQTPDSIIAGSTKLPVAIIREEGSNGDREMTSAFYAAGFEPWDVTITDLQSGRVRLDHFRGAVFVGGFSYADVLDSAKGWAGVIRFDPKLWQQFEDFAKSPDTFSLGVCNGCQLLALLGWVPWQHIRDEESPRFIQNRSGRFESRFSTLQVEESPALMLKGMEGSRLGIWVAHGEGRAYFPNQEILQKVLEERLAPVRFVDDDNRITETYPFNPNGSPAGIAGLCSPDGRHLAMMPHPERVFLKWQWGWMPEEWKKTIEVSPWLRMFQNAREWCEQH
jgi:phosphoribosylformylglycinamidine synthase